MNNKEKQDFDCDDLFALFEKIHHIHDSHNLLVQLYGAIDWYERQQGYMNDKQLQECIQRVKDHLGYEH